jgi:hypothetical protein
MLRDEQPRLWEVVTLAIGEYAKRPTADELEQWWATCRVFSLDAVERALKAHAMDSDDGKRAPRPVDVKRRLAVPQRDHGGREFAPVDENSERMRAYRQACISSPSVVNTAHAIALKLGNRPWPSDADRLRVKLPKKFAEA